MPRTMLSSIFFLFLFGFSFLESGCEGPIKKYFEEIYTPDLYEHSGYNLSSPDTILSLPADLAEISGLSYIDENHLAAVQDEKGKIFIIDTRNGTISSTIKFAKKGDYEGITIVNESVYVVKSNGRIYTFKLDLEVDELESTVIETPLTSKNDVEGLAYDKETNSLLIACKASGEADGNEAKGKCVYSYDLQAKKFIKTPTYSIRKKNIEKILERDYQNIKLKSSLGPSGIAIHPVSNDIYVLNHVGKALVILDRDGEVKKYYPLNPHIFQQPEGICFNENGDLFISNEASTSRANIMRFNFRQ